MINLDLFVAYYFDDFFFAVPCYLYYKAYTAVRLTNKISANQYTFYPVQYILSIGLVEVSTTIFHHLD